MWSRSTYEFVDLYYVWGSSCVEMGFTIMSMSKPAHQKHPKENVLELLSLPWVLLLNADLWELWNSWSGNPSVNRNMFCSLLFSSAEENPKSENTPAARLWTILSGVCHEAVSWYTRRAWATGPKSWWTDTPNFAFNLSCTWNPMTLWCKTAVV